MIKNKYHEVICEMNLTDEDILEIENQRSLLQ
jgi:hypothetical protein